MSLFKAPELIHFVKEGICASMESTVGQFLFSQYSTMFILSKVVCSVALTSNIIALIQQNLFAWNLAENNSPPKEIFIFIFKSIIRWSYQDTSSAWRVSSPWISQKEPWLLFHLRLLNCDGGGEGWRAPVRRIGPRADASKSPSGGSKRTPATLRPLVVL